MFEANRFQTLAYLFKHVQVLFGIDSDTRVLPWKYDEPPPEDGLLIRQSFLEYLPVMSLLHLFKDLLGWAERKYQGLEHYGVVR